MAASDLLLQFIGNYNYRRTLEARFDHGLAFTEDATPTGGEVADTIQVTYSQHKSTSFAYNRGTGQYRVSQNNEVLIDGITEEQLQVTNVLVLLAEFRVIDNEGRLTVNFSAGGRGFYASGGRIIEIRWSKASYTAPFVYTLENGQPLELAMGTSYINIVNASGTGGVTFE